MVTEEIKIKYYGLRLNKKNFIYLFAAYFLINLGLMVFFFISPVDPKVYANDPSIIQFLIKNTHFAFALSLVHTVIEGQFFWNKFTKRQLEIIETLRHDLEERNKEILDSIRYAKRIQTSLLPTEKYIERILNEKGENNGA